ncbi:MAG: DUF427 domain-containing protein [Chloroflexota bacterium]
MPPSGDGSRPAADIALPVANPESAWEYPRPPRLEATSRRVRVVLGGVTVADSVRALRVVETSHPPTYYVPPADVRLECLEALPGVGSVCEWKGAARYFHVSAGGQSALRAAWSYPQPTPAFRALADHLAFYVRQMDACFVDAERARPQPGGFYGGWVTSDVVGPFKGEPGSEGW